MGDHLLAQAGPAAEGFEAVYPYDPSRTDPKWVDFNQRFEAKYNEKPEQFAALAYDAMNALLASICKAGLNRARIHDALSQIYEYDGVTQHMVFDPLNKNVSPMYLGTVHDGKITYRVERWTTAFSVQQSAISKEPEATTPYARVGEEGVSYLGPHEADIAGGTAKIVLFGPHAADVASSAAVRDVLTASPTLSGVIPVESGQNWGKASTELVKALMDEHAVAIVALDRDCAHLAEQLALKTFVPVVALSDDKALTSTNVPWIFRLPATTKPADALRLLAEAERSSGNNPEKLRAVLASGTRVAGMRFQPTGEPAN